MSLHPTGDGREDNAEDGERPEVPAGVLRGIETLPRGALRVKTILWTIHSRTATTSRSSIREVARFVSSVL